MVISPSRLTPMSYAALRARGTPRRVRYRLSAGSASKRLTSTLTARSDSTSGGPVECDHLRLPDAPSTSYSTELDCVISCDLSNRMERLLLWMSASAEHSPPGRFLLRVFVV